MLSLARSRYTLVSQFVFVAANGVGVLLAVIYNTSTPDLYPNNAHHKLGWIITWVVGAQILVSLLGSVTGALRGKQVARTGSWREAQGFMPVSTEAMEDHNSRFPKAYRLSNDSGQGTEPSSESSRSQSLSSGADSPPIPLRDAQKEYGDDEEDNEDDLEAHALPGVSRGSAVHRLAAKAAGMISSRAWSILMLVYNLIDRTILILGFIALCTGVITFGRFFVRLAQAPPSRVLRFQLLTFANRREIRSLPAWLTGSRAVSSSGSACSPSVVGREASATSDGRGMCGPNSWARSGAPAPSLSRAASSSFMASPISFWSILVARAATGLLRISSICQLPSCS